MSNNMEIDNKSSFTNCSFIVNDNALFTVSNNESQVSLQYVKGVRFNGCNFIDAQPKSSLDNMGLVFILITPEFALMIIVVLLISSHMKQFLVVLVVTEQQYR